MKVIFRVDASLQIGTGHVMRCLTLANALANAGATCEFICRAHPGHLIDFISQNRYATHVLSMAANGENTWLQPTDSQDLAHHHWLGATQAQDAEACSLLLAQSQADWLIVDHYSLDDRWERVLAPHSRKIMVIDDLADRRHACDLLLDQTFGRVESDYRALVAAGCRLLCGTQYALLRPEFVALRPYSLQRRVQPVLRKLLITMGGVDKDNATCQVLQALRQCTLASDCSVTVVMGTTAPWLEAVKTLSQELPWPTEVLVGVSNMAQLMADSDLAIGAAGATSWERCCLGLPSAMLVIADNQQKAANLLEEASAARTLSSGVALGKELANFIDELFHSTKYLRKLSERASVITDGAGCQRLMALLIEKEHK